MYFVVKTQEVQPGDEIKVSGRRKPLHVETVELRRGSGLYRLAEKGRAPLYLFPDRPVEVWRET